MNILLPLFLLTTLFSTDHALDYMKRLAEIRNLVRNERQDWKTPIEPILSLLENWEQRNTSSSEDGIICHLCQSDGSLSTNYALRCVKNPERIQVVAVNPSEPISRKVAGEVYNVRRDDAEKTDITSKCFQNVLRDFLQRPADRPLTAIEFDPSLEQIEDKLISELSKKFNLKSLGKGGGGLINGNTHTCFFECPEEKTIEEARKLLVGMIDYLVTGFNNVLSNSKSYSNKNFEVYLSFRKPDGGFIDDLSFSSCCSYQGQLCYTNSLLDEQRFLFKETYDEAVSRL